MNVGLQRLKQGTSVLRRFTLLLSLHADGRRDAPPVNQYQSVISIPKKRGKSGTVNYMSPEGIKHILEQPDAKTMSGRRDMVLLSLMYDSGARVQEMADISVGDFRAEPPATIKITGKGGKTRIVPLMEPMNNHRAPIHLCHRLDKRRQALRIRCSLNRHGGRLTRAGITYILDKCVESPARNKNPGVLPEVVIPSLFSRSPWKAMHLLHAGVNLVYIRDILGHVQT